MNKIKVRKRKGIKNMFPVFHSSFFSSQFQRKRLFRLNMKLRYIVEVTEELAVLAKVQKAVGLEGLKILGAIDLVQCGLGLEEPDVAIERESKVVENQEDLQTLLMKLGGVMHGQQ